MDEATHMTTNDTTPQRAKKGGEIGANGEFYKGGAFIATTDHPKGQPIKRSKVKKQEVEPFNWTVPPEEGLKSLYGVLGGVEFYDKETKTFKLNHLLTGRNYYASPEQVKERKYRIAAFNSGMRWFKPFTDEVLAG